MSGKPNPEGVKRVIDLLDSVAKLDDEIAELSARVDSDQRRINLLSGNRAEAWKEHCDLMRQMDVSAEGNTGFEKRAAWFLAEMRRQLKAEKGDR